MIIFCP